jgi:hypothetical protein
MLSDLATARRSLCVIKWSNVSLLNNLVCKNLFCSFFPSKAFALNIPRLIDKRVSLLGVIFAIICSLSILLAPQLFRLPKLNFFYQSHQELTNASSISCCKKQIFRRIQSLGVLVFSSHSRLDHTTTREEVSHAHINNSHLTQSTILRPESSII